MTIARVLTAVRRDGGFSLPEMLVASSLFSLVILVAGGIFLGQFRAQQQVSAVTSTTTDAQLAGSAIDNGIRNSNWFKVIPSGGDQMLVARVAGSGASLEWSCQAWYYSATAGTIRTTTSPSPIALPTGAQLSTWALLVDGVVPRTGTTIFSEAGSTVTVAFNATTGEDYKPVAILLTTSPLADFQGDVTCY